PNIILFITHDQGQYLGCYNSPQAPNSLNTPNIDKLAAKGIKFTNYFCTAPQCSPSRGSIQTSLYPHQNGLMGLANLGWNLPNFNKTLPIYLRENGYSTHLVGLQHETNHVEDLGYDDVSKRMKDYKYSIKNVIPAFIEFLKNHDKDKKPFYVNVGTIESHRPFIVWNDPVSPSKVKVPPFLPDNEMIREDLGQFYGAVEIVDKGIGEILAFLEDSPLFDNTLFIYTTDHGIAFPRAKCTLYDPGLKTSLIMSLPSSEYFSGGKVFNQMISNIDLLPTILDLIKAQILKSLEGKSFLKVLMGESDSFREFIFAEKTFHEIYDPIRGIRTERYKYIYNFKPLDTLYQVPRDISMGLSGKCMKDHYNNPRLTEELYDLENDPNEFANLSENSDYNDIKESLKKKLFEWMRRTNDPILKGDIKKEDL
ncbi:MAG: sulfatase family protein, partial [Promethearchaeota archaeon]